MLLLIPNLRNYQLTLNDEKEFSQSDIIKLKKDIKDQDKHLSGYTDHFLLQKYKYINENIFIFEQDPSNIIKFIEASPKKIQNIIKTMIYLKYTKGDFPLEVNHDDKTLTNNFLSRVNNEVLDNHTLEVITGRPFTPLSRR